MKKTLIVLFGTLLLLSIVDIAHADSDIASALDRIGNKVIKTFRSLDLYLDLSSKRLADKSIDSFNQQALSGKTFVTQINVTSIDPFTLNQILNEVRFGVPYAFDVAFVDRNGIIQGIQPPFPGALGSDISGQEQFQRVSYQKVPVLSRMFLAVEGFYAVAFQHPVLTSDGVFLGATSLLIRPQTLLKGVIDVETKGLRTDVWVMQDDGVIIYDKDNEEIGRNLFTDKLYQPFTGLVQLGKKIAVTERGFAQYDFYATGSDKVIKKNAGWITVDVYGNKWKIIATTSVDTSISPERTLCELGAETIDEALIKLSQDRSFLDAASANDEDSVKDILSGFLEKYPCYSIQWVDSDLVNRVGVPDAHFIPGYKFNASNSPKEAQFVSAVNSKQESSFEAPLFESGIAKFHLAPMFKGNEYLGMVYYIGLNP